MRSSIDCTWLLWREIRLPSLSVVTTQLAPEASLVSELPSPPPREVPISVPVTKGLLPCRDVRRRLMARSSAVWGRKVESIKRLA